MKNLAYLAIVREIEDQELFGSACYTVQISQEFQNYINIHIPNLDEEEVETHNCWLAIKYNQIQIISIGMKNIILEITYDDILRIEPFANSIILVIQNDLIQELKLKTVSSYAIR